MPSVINAARNSSSSVFDLVGSIATTATKGVESLSLTLDAAHLKARELHSSVQANVATSMVHNDELAIDEAALRVLEHRSKIAKMLNAKFNLVEEFTKLRGEMRQALDQERNP